MDLDQILSKNQALEVLCCVYDSIKYNATTCGRLLATVNIIKKMALLL